MRYLVDTMVLSEGFKRHPHPNVVAWFRERSRDEVAISVVSLGEIARGVRKLEALASPLAPIFSQWFEETIEEYGDRTLPLTVEIMRRWGPLTYDLRHTNPDVLIAATALEHDLTLVTRNVRHFEPTGVRVLDPYR